MNVRQMTAGQLSRRGYPVQRMLKAAAKSLGYFARPALATFLAVLVAEGRSGLRTRRNNSPLLLQNGQAFPPRKHRRKRFIPPRREIHRFRSRWEVQNITTRVRPRPFPISSRRIAQSEFPSHC